MPAGERVQGTGIGPRFKPYPVYRDSGVEWLGRVPAHWEVKRLRFSARLNPPPSEARGLPSATEVSFVPMEAIGEYGGLELTRTKALADVGVGYTYFRDGDVVVAKITPCFENGKGARAAGLANGLAFGTTELHVLRASPALDESFLFYLTLSHAVRRLGASEMYGAGGQKRVPESFLLNFRHPLPPIAEQRAVAAFLERETAAIDRLSSQRECQLALLDEARWAAVTAVVTHGLNSSVPMKRWELPWIAERIPAHWTVKRLKFISPSQSVGVVVNPSDYFSDEGVPFLFGNNVRAGEVLLDGVKRISPESNRLLAKSILHAGDLVTVRVGAPGVTAVVPKELDGCNCASMMIVRQSPRFVSDWLCYAMNSRLGRTQVELVQYGAAQEQFNISHAVDFAFPVPPLEEQRAMAAHLDHLASRTNRVNAALRSQVAGLCEYRQALISAAVTGKIDVREAS